MNPEEMKQQWNELNKRIDALEEINLNQINRMRLDKLKTAQDRLIAFYRRFTILSPIFILLSVLWVDNNLIGPVAAYYFMAFFAIAGMMDLYLWQSVKRLDFNTMGVEMIADRARFYRKRHHLFQIIMIVLAIPLITMIVIHNMHDRYMLTGCVLGLTLGSLIGLSLYTRIMGSYRDLISSYR